jgi:hypothetical protein
MVNTSTRYIVYNHSGSGVRHHHFSTSNDIISEAHGHASAGDELVAQGFPFQWYMGQMVPFAFMSVHHAQDDKNYLYTSAGNQDVTVGEHDLDILVVYAPPGGFGGPDGGPGVWVDAFNVDTGDFSDALDFIQVLTPPTPPASVDVPKTNYANMEGVVSTLSAENLRAKASVDANVPFREWKRIAPMETLVNSSDVDLAQNQSDEIWFAFYQTVPPVIDIRDLEGEIMSSLGRWGSDDYCGNGRFWPHGGPIGPIGPNGPAFKITLPASLTRSLTATQKESLASLSREYTGIANSAWNEMVKALDVLGQISGILAKTGKSKYIQRGPRLMPGPWVGLGWVFGLGLCYS